MLGVSGYTVTTAPQKLSQDFQEFKAKLDCKGRPCFETLIQSKFKANLSSQRSSLEIKNENKKINTKRTEEVHAGCLMTAG